MRVVIVGRRKKLIAAESGLRGALKRLGHDVIIVDDRKLRQRIGRAAGNQWLRWRIRTFRPDRVIFFKNHDVEVEIIHEITARTPTSKWFRDLTVPPDPEMIRRAAAIDDVFITAGGQVDQWKAGGAHNVMWLPNAADRDMDKPVPPDPRFACDIAFMGRGVSPGVDHSRSEFLVQLARRFHVRVWGQQWDQWAKELNWDGSAAYGEDFARVCASAKIVLDIQPVLWVHSGYDDLYSSNRMVKVMSCGGFCLSQGAPGVQKLFKEGEHAAWWFKSNDEAFAQIEKYMSNDKLREDVRRNGMEFVHKYHMMDNRVHNLLTGEPFRNPRT